MTKLFQLKNNYYEVIKYNDDNWIETDDQIIENQLQIQRKIMCYG